MAAGIPAQRHHPRMAKFVDIQALIDGMTVEEKIGQLTILADSVRPYAFEVNPDSFQWGPDAVRDLIRAGRVGALFNGVGAVDGAALQRMAVEESRLGIPLLFGADVIHGMRTVFPIPLGEAASFEPALAERTARAAAIEATREGLHWTFAPVVDIARDQRWGRVAETTGEDTWLACRFAQARVRGFQGEDLTADDSLLATPKHFAAYGAVAAGLDYNTVDVSPQTLHEVHLPPFKAAIDAGALSIMSSFNDINGVPATANRALLTTLLRGQWGFEGFVVSDYTSDFELIAHGFAEDTRHAAKLSLDAGLDMSMQSGAFLDHVADLVADGSLSMATLDTAVRRVLEVKARMGLFDNPYRSLDPAKEAAPADHLPDHDALARTVARRSVVMLKNDGDVLPLHRAGQRIALIGPFANDRENLAGCWNIFGDGTREIDLATGLRAALADPGALAVVDGCGIEEAIPGGLDAALAAARASDVVVLAVGEPTRYSGEAQSRTQIVLPRVQQQLVEAIVACGKPVVLLLRTGRALALGPEVRAADAILVTWFLGTQTGHAVADLLFGDESPSGRLPVSFPHDAGQQPYFYNHTATGRPYEPGGLEAFRTRWREATHTALYPFGHGLTYTRFEYRDVRLDRSLMAWDGAVVAIATIANVGDRAAEEVVQLYVRDRVASRVRPIRELKGFEKIALAPGESREVRFTLTRADLGFRDIDNRPTVEPGLFDVWIAPSAQVGDALQFELLAPGAATG